MFLRFCLVNRLSCQIGGPDGNGVQLLRNDSKRILSQNDKVSQKAWSDAALAGFFKAGFGACDGETVQRLLDCERLVRQIRSQMIPQGSPCDSALDAGHHIRLFYGCSTGLSDPLLTVTPWFIRVFQL